jgi:hypothetical protein
MPPPTTITAGTAHNNTTGIVVLLLQFPCRDPAAGKSAAGQKQTSAKLAIRSALGQRRKCRFL